MSNSETRPFRGGLSRFYVVQGLQGDSFYVLDGQTGQPVNSFTQAEAVEIVDLLNATPEDPDP